MKKKLLLIVILLLFFSGCKKAGKVETTQTTVKKEKYNDILSGYFSQEEEYEKIIEENKDIELEKKEEETPKIEEGKFIKSNVIGIEIKKKTEEVKNISEDIIYKNIYKLSEELKASDLYFDESSNSIYLVGKDFSGIYNIEDMRTQYIRNMETSYTGIDKMDENIYLFENKRNILLYSDKKEPINLEINVASFTIGGGKFWFYDENNNFIYILDRKKEKNGYKYEAYGKLEYKGIEKLTGIRIKDDYELWGCTENEIFIFDEYFKIRYRYKLDENISGISFSNKENTKDEIVIYASTENKNEIYKYKIKRR